MGTVRSWKLRLQLHAVSSEWLYIDWKPHKDNVLRTSWCSCIFVCVFNRCHFIANNIDKLLWLRNVFFDKVGGLCDMSPKALTTLHKCPAHWHLWVAGKLFETRLVWCMLYCWFGLVYANCNLIPAYFYFVLYFNNMMCSILLQ